jgi:hypothetical protein
MRYGLSMSSFYSSIPMNRTRGIYGKRMVAAFKNGVTRKAVQYLNARGMPLPAAAKKTRRLRGRRARAATRRRNIRRIKK